jgi:Fic family protein
VQFDLLSESPIGRLTPVQGNDARYGPYACFAYMPDPLPDNVDGLAMETLGAIAEASSALSRLDQACSQLNDPGLLIWPSLYREALDTSALEGTYGHLTDVLEAQLPGFQQKSPETREIYGYMTAAISAFGEIRARPITVGLLCDAQGEMFREVEHPPSDRGKVRQHQVWIGQRDAPITDARFVPLPGDDRLRAAMDSLVEWIGAENSWPIVLRAAMAHYQFETLHPFSDGNGRIGRLAIVLYLLQSGMIRHPAITISPWLLRRRDEYQDQLFALSCTGDWNPWVQFFCQAVVAQCDALILGAERLTGWLETSRAQINQHRWAGAIYDVLAGLSESPMTTIAKISTQYNVTPTAASNIVNHLTEIGVLEETTGRDYGRVFGATAVMTIVDAI